jgi:hypothetical protein
MSEDNLSPPDGVAIPEAASIDRSIDRVENLYLLKTAAILDGLCGLRNTILIKCSLAQI